MWMSLSYFSLGFLSQNSLWKLSTFHGYKGYLYLSEKGMRRVIFFITEKTSDLASRLDWVVSPSRKLTEWPDWTFCPVVLHVAWRFNFSACFTRVHFLAACKPRATRESLLHCPVLRISLHSFTHYPYMIPI